MKSEFRYTKKITDEASRYNLNPDELAIVDLVAAGWPKDVAFKLIFRVGATWSPTALNKEASDIVDKAGARKRINEHHALKKQEEEEARQARKRKKEEEEAQNDEKVLLEKLSKENMLVDLARARDKMVAGSKDWLDVNKLIADITRMKQDEVKTEDTTIHFFIPMQCYQCSLYLNSKKK